MGIEQESMLDTYLTYKNEGILNYLKEYPATMIDEKGNITGYKYEDFKSSIGSFTTNDGQVWLDGIFMGLPYYTMAAPYMKGEKKAVKYYNDAVDQITKTDKRTYDEKTNLWKHAWDETHSMFWANKACEELRAEFPAEKAGLHVLIAESEKPYHERKVTLLNGPHTVLSPVTYLSGVNIVRDACNHEVLGKYIHKVQFEELMETLNLPMDELRQFATDVLERFNNPYVDHQVTSIMLNSFPKFQARDLPGVKTYLERKGELPQGLVFGLAAIITYYKGGKRADGAEIVPNDDQKIMDLLKELWATGDTQKVTDGVLGAEFIWGEDLHNVAGLAELVKKDLDLIQEKGMLEAVKTIL